jgi:hypothetical protein
MFNLHQILPCFVLEMTDVPYSDSDKRGDSGRSDYYGAVTPEERHRMEAAETRLEAGLAAHAAREAARKEARRAATKKAAGGAAVFAVGGAIGLACPPLGILGGLLGIAAALDDSGDDV